MDDIETSVSKSRTKYVIAHADTRDLKRIQKLLFIRKTQLA